MRKETAVTSMEGGARDWEGHVGARGASGKALVLSPGGACSGARVTKIRSTVHRI